MNDSTQTVEKKSQKKKTAEKKITPQKEQTEGKRGHKKRCSNHQLFAFLYFVIGDSVLEFIDPVDAIFPCFTLRDLNDYFNQLISIGHSKSQRPPYRFYRNKVRDKVASILKDQWVNKAGANEILISRTLIHSMLHNEWNSVFEMDDNTPAYEPYQFNENVTESFFTSYRTAYKIKVIRSNERYGETMLAPGSLFARVGTKNLYNPPIKLNEFGIAAMEYVGFVINRNTWNVTCNCSPLGDRHAKEMELLDLLIMPNMLVYYMHFKLRCQFLKLLTLKNPNWTANVNPNLRNYWTRLFLSTNDISYLEKDLDISQSINESPFYFPQDFLDKVHAYKHRFFSDPYLVLTDENDHVASSLDPTDIFPREVQKVSDDDDDDDYELSLFENLSCCDISGTTHQVGAPYTEELQALVEITERVDSVDDISPRPDSIDSMISAITITPGFLDLDDDMDTIGDCSMVPREGNLFAPLFGEKPFAVSELLPIVVPPLRVAKRRLPTFEIKERESDFNVRFKKLDANVGRISYGARDGGYDTALVIAEAGLTEQKSPIVVTWVDNLCFSRALIANFLARPYFRDVFAKSSQVICPSKLNSLLATNLRDKPNCQSSAVSPITNMEVVRGSDGLRARFQYSLEKIHRQAFMLDFVRLYCETMATYEDNPFLMGSLCAAGKGMEGFDIELKLASFVKIYEELHGLTNCSSAKQLTHSALYLGFNQYETELNNAYIRVFDDIANPTITTFNHELMCVEAATLFGVELHIHNNNRSVDIHNRNKEGEDEKMMSVHLYLNGNHWSTEVSDNDLDEKTLFTIEEKKQAATALKVLQSYLTVDSSQSLQDNHVVLSLTKRRR